MQGFAQALVWQVLYYEARSENSHSQARRRGLWKVKSWEFFIELKYCIYLTRNFSKFTQANKNQQAITYTKQNYYKLKQRVFKN